MPAYKLRFLVGPCNGRTESRFFTGVPPKHLTCGGQNYNLEPSTDASSLAYVLGSADQLIQPGEVLGQRDVFKSWARLHRALNHTTRKELLRVRAASHRIRRAVR
jgi:hypothetical protein